MKHFKILFSLLAICFAACGDDPSPSPTPPDPPSGKSERSVLIYMAANSDLTTKGLFSADFEEMKNGSTTLNDTQNLIVYVNTKGSDQPYLARLKDGQVVDSTPLEGSVSSDPATLEEALRYMREKYPAKSYGLVFWGHANGWQIRNDSVVYAKTRSYGYDVSTSPTTWMNFPSIARAIKNGMNGEKLTYIFGDCCDISSPHQPRFLERAPTMPISPISSTPVPPSIRRSSTSIGISTSRHSWGVRSIISIIMAIWQAIAYRLWLSRPQNSRTWQQPPLACSRPSLTNCSLQAPSITAR